MVGSYALFYKICKEAIAKLEGCLDSMGIAVLDRIPVMHFNKDYMLPALVEARKNLAMNYEDFRFDGFMP